MMLAAGLSATSAARRVEKTVETKAWGLFRRRQCMVPTWKGWLFLLLVLGSAATLTIRGIHSFLAVNEPVTGGVLVVEGWAQDYALQFVADELNRHRYDRVYVTGGPIDVGAVLVEYRTYAERATAILIKLGVSTNAIQAVPAPYVRQDRTYVSAMMLRAWWRRHGIIPKKINLVSEGMHARRSRLLFRRALGKGVQVGITAIPPRDYDPQHWWRYSAGVRGAIGEGLAYLYAAVLFHPSREASPPWAQ